MITRAFSAFRFVRTFCISFVLTSASVLTNLKAEKALVITADNDQNVILSARNIADVETATPATINTYDVMKHNTVVVTKDAVASIEEVYA